MTLYNIKPRFQNLLRPLTRTLYAKGVTANQVTSWAAILSVLLGLTLMCFPSPRLYLLLPVFLFIRMALNAIDGMLAREFNQKSQLGAVLNETGDIVSDAALYLAFAFLPGVNLWLVVAVILLAWMTEFCGVLSQTLNGIRQYQGPLGKSDRALLLGACGLCIAIFPQTMVYLNVVFILAGVLSLATVLNRCRAALKEGNVSE
ncbi:CDP-alcohol phosphatidyltransferase family protein [Klebsiella aerogenes]|uniref:CDP-alcohol phosphatidyltransferase family protein n=1 Tax=Klebsiella aerogenes TaxID=548 RepID=A0AAP9U9E7_KLEAE|nr:CDP-alcohol phosphatidyltransferase family protein [Klebsiella aerogenes]QMR43207.1 CDP-alcohol phosphatidyltransferase family protein [Klebsiella aerogenes]